MIVCYSLECWYDFGSFAEPIQEIWYGIQILSTISSEFFKPPDSHYCHATRVVWIRYFSRLVSPLSCLFLDEHLLRHNFLKYFLSHQFLFRPHSLCYEFSCALDPECPHCNYSLHPLVFFANRCWVISESPILFLLKMRHHIFEKNKSQMTGHLTITSVLFTIPISIAEMISIITNSD